MMARRHSAGARAVLLLSCCSPACGGAHGGPTSSGAAAPARAPAQAAPNHADATLPKLFKGYELYAWEDSNGLRFMLITGTNREKTLEELTAENGAIEQGDWIAISGRGLDALRRVLARLPEGTELALHEFAQLPPLDAATRAQVEALVARPR